MNREHRALRALMLFTMLAPAFGPAAAVLLPIAALVALARSKRGGFFVGMLASFVVWTTLAFVLSISDPRAQTPLGQLAPALALLAFLGALLSPFIAAAPLLRSRFGSAKAAGLLFVGAAGALGPAIGLSLKGEIGPLGALLEHSLQTLPFVLCSIVAMLPLLWALPPHPELEALAQRLGLQRRWWGWEGEDLRLSRRGLLSLDLHFQKEIPGLHAAKRGQHSTLPLLGDPVLDNTLELSLPQGLGEILQDPTQLLEAVHGAGAVLTPQGLHMEQQVAKLLREDTARQAARIHAQIVAARALHREIEAQSLARGSEDVHPQGEGRKATQGSAVDAREG